MWKSQNQTASQITQTTDILKVSGINYTKLCIYISSCKSKLLRKADNYDYICLHQNIHVYWLCTNLWSVLYLHSLYYLLLNMLQYCCRNSESLLFRSGRYVANVTTIKLPCTASGRSQFKRSFSGSGFTTVTMISYSSAAGTRRRPEWSWSASVGVVIAATVCSSDFSCNNQDSKTSLSFTATRNKIQTLMVHFRSTRTHNSATNSVCYHDNLHLYYLKVILYYPNGLLLEFWSITLCMHVFQALQNLVSVTVKRTSDKEYKPWSFLLHEIWFYNAMFSFYYLWLKTNFKTWTWQSSGI